jgi:hypothetical protein
MSPAIISIIVSVFSLAISGTTAWLSVFRRGRLAMTMPSVVFFGYDEVPTTIPKVFLRTLLYSTATQGQVVETMYITVNYPSGGRRIFSTWGLDEGSKLVPGSGLYVGRSGVAANHHFVHSMHDLPFDFQPGVYRLEVSARVAGRRQPCRLALVSIDLSHANAHALSKHDGVVFERTPDTLEYLGHIQQRPAVRRGKAPVPKS